MRCEREGCKWAATHMPVCCVPAVGAVKDFHSAMQMFCGVRLCKFHANEFKVDPLDASNAALREAMTITARIRSSVPLDFTRAWMEFRRLESPEVQTFLRIQQEKPGYADA